MARGRAGALPLLEEVGLKGYPKTTGKRGIHVYLRLEPRWDAYQVRSAAVAVARELERRRPDLLTAAWWKEERGERIFVDYNQNAPHKTVFGAWCVRPRPGAQVSTPFAWDELDDIDPDELTIATVPAAGREQGDPWAGMYADPQSLEPLLAMHERDRENGLHGRAVAAGLPEDARRAAEGRAEPGPKARRGLSSRRPSPRRC
jgi:DNA primase